RPLMSRLARYHEEQGQIATGMLAMLFVGIILSALITDRIGIHAIFGAFLFGAIMPARSEFISELVPKLEDFTVVVLLPLVTTFMTTPLLSVFYPRRMMEEMVAAASGDADADDRPLMTVVVPVAKLAAAGPVVHTALRLAGNDGERLRIVLLRPVQSPGSAFRAGPQVQESMMARATQSLRPLV